MSNLLIDNSFAKRSPVSNASYSASLFQARKPSVMACSNRVSSRVIMTMPTPAPLRFDAPSMCNYHKSLCWSSSAEKLSFAL